MMFSGWGFLLGEIWILLVLAALLGLFVGWVIWGRSVVEESSTEADQLRNDLAACQARGRQQLQRIASLQTDLSASELAAATLAAAQVPVAEPEAVVAPMPEPEIAPEPTPAAEPESEPEVKADAAPIADGQGVKPATLAAARDGVADDLKRISGIGPKLEMLCNRLGFWHFNQIATWTDSEIAWVDQNLEGFKGRVTRDKWVSQAARFAGEDASKS
jgi:predicted flap endonuclease-1-like 5' DNA nuclease